METWWAIFAPEHSARLTDCGGGRRVARFAGLWLAGIRTSCVVRFPMPMPRTHDRRPLTVPLASAVLQQYGATASQVGIVQADCSDVASLRAMCTCTSVVVNCAGPFRFLGEPVVRACIDAGTHMVDVSGEPEYIERMIALYAEAARAADAVRSTALHRDIAGHGRAALTAGRCARLCAA